MVARKPVSLVEAMLVCNMQPYYITFNLLDKLLMERHACRSNIGCQLIAIGL